MRRALRLAVAAVAVAVATLAHAAPAARPEPKQPAAAAAAPAVQPRRVIAYYFHTTVRCASCRAIEAYSKEAIDSAFAGEVRDGKLVWKVVNIEVKGNEHFAKDYALYTKSVVLVNEVGGKPAEWKNLDKVWQLLQDKPKFLRYVQTETRGFLAAHS
ncbi:MAG: hypothetical protein IT348_01460 [Candidatus Eisenbacteria bacterium]|nr:hypothetical protein [Candidatus Eisenbacteria bacterium]